MRERRRIPVPPEPERQFQQAVVDLAKALGWRVQFTWSSRHSPSGWPDLFMVQNGRAIAAEIKVVGKDPRPDQQAWLDELGAVPGIESYCWRPGDMQAIARVLRGTE